MTLLKKCRHCGTEIDFRKYGAGKLCPHCGKPTATVNITEVHVSFNNWLFDYPFSSRLVPLEVGIDYHIVRLYYEMCIGDISAPPYSNANAYPIHYSSAAEWKLSIETQLEKLVSVPDDVPVHIWHAETDINGYLNLCHFAQIFKRFRSLFFIPCYTREELNDDTYTLWDSYINKRQIWAEDLDSWTNVLTTSSVIKADYRIGIGNKVVPCTSELLYSYVLHNITEEFKEFNSIYSAVNAQVEKRTGCVITYHTVQNIVSKLMLNGKIECRGHIDDPICVKSFRLL